ncbi:Hypothetical_protein [Hexamita inflata]|uniref:Hypothetical_protein n=1 Tax=Hexamita inflata TaxID=28002 RepID=A0AA86N6D0_9EUKA|nr:Hypothetical protein HINF_LOCUS767 [Hexamita inflata]CAI9913697.1 Hypothetical protein HINF_LOCUS1342 [Hexamita inflata]CAI9930306.1 Hypothetical protein HINF_LOCUS17951 [Hexamita inflata]
MLPYCEYFGEYQKILSSLHLEISAPCRDSCQLLELQQGMCKLELAFSLPGVQIPGWNQVPTSFPPLLLPLGLAFGRLVRFSLAFEGQHFEKCRFPTVNTEEGLFWRVGLTFLVGNLDFALSDRAFGSNLQGKQGEMLGDHLGPSDFTAWQAYQHAT